MLSRVYALVSKGYRLVGGPMTTETATERGAEWKATACILCECNCGILVKLGGEDGRRFEQIRGDKAKPAARGYRCQKALRLDHYRTAAVSACSTRSGGARTALSRRSIGTPRSPRSPRRVA